MESENDTFECKLCYRELEVNGYYFTLKEECSDVCIECIHRLIEEEQKTPSHKNQLEKEYWRKKRAFWLTLQPNELIMELAALGQQKDCYLFHFNSLRLISDRHYNRICDNIEFIKKEISINKQKDNN